MWNLKAKKEQQLRPYGDAIARIIAGKINLLQQRIVHLLQPWDQRYSIGKKKILLLIFCMACSGYCGNLLIRALSGKADHVAIPLGRIPPVAKPPPFYRPKDSVRMNPDQ
jgi:hypothetical protein